jgi:RNA polymerase sigma factor (sigma-70 family)
MNTTGPDDGARAHRKRFLDALYRKYASLLVRFISRQNVSPEEAKEIVQETYCRLHQIPQLETLQYPRGYLFRTAINLARDIKRQQRLGYAVMRAADGGLVAPADVPSGEPNAYRVLNGEQELAIIRQAIDELSPTCRDVFIMHRFESATYREIAAHLGLSVSMIEKYVRQALAHLKARLDEAHAGDAGPSDESST